MKITQRIYIHTLLGKKWSRPLLGIFFLGLTSSAAEPGIKIFVSLKPAGSFVAKSSELKIQGSIKKEGDQLLAKNLALELASLKTGISLRDQHMKNKYFEIGKFPFAVLTSAQGSGGAFTGQLEIRKAIKDIKGTYELLGDQFIGKFKCRLSDFKIPPAQFMNVGVEDEVEVEVQLPSQPQEVKKEEKKK